MKQFLLIAAVFAVAFSERDYEEEERKYHLDMGTMFKKHLIPLNTRVALEANYYTKGHFIISAHSIWYNLATMAETLAEGDKLISLLGLPDDSTLRRQFYSRALMLEGLGENVLFSKSQAIAVDETVDVNENWFTFEDLPFGMPDYLPSVTYSKPFGHVQKYIPKHELDIPYSRHTVLLDHLMFDALWNSAFSDRPVQGGPFYNEEKEPIATVDYLTMKDKVRVYQSPDNSFKVLEVPVGSEREHLMLFAVGDKMETMIEAISNGDIFLDLKETEEAIEVAIPRLLMSSGIDMAPILRNMRRSKEFVDPADTSNNPETPDTPIGYFQLVSVNITDSVGRGDSKDVPDKEIDLAALEKDGFIINKPFLFALFVPLQKTDIRVPVFFGAYSYPGERGQQKIFDQITGEDQGHQ